MTPEVCMVRTAAARKLGLSAKKVKVLFSFGSNSQVFSILYGNHCQVNCHLVVATMAILLFEDMCRYNMLIDLSERIFNLNRILALSR